MIKSLLKATAVVALISIPTTSQAFRDDLPNLFDEDLLLYVEVPSVPQLQDDWKENPLYELYQREDVKEFIDSYIGFSHPRMESDLAITKKLLRMRKTRKSLRNC